MADTPAETPSEPAATEAAPEQKPVEIPQALQGWSEHARNAYAHLIAAEIIHSKAADICIENGIEFEKTGRSEYEHLLRAVQKRTPR